MRLKHYIFALVAMFFGFSFSALAQTEVGDASALKSALETGGEVQLSADIEVTEMVVIPEGMTVTLDLNGYDINGGCNGSSTTNHIYALSNKGTLTITDTSADKDGSINSRGVWNYGSLTLEAGKIAAIDGNGGYAMNNESGSTFVMNGGWLAADNEDGNAPGEGSDATALDVPSGCTATLNAGKITNAGNYTFAIAAAGTLNIPETSTITVEGRHGAINVSDGTTTIDAGTFSIPENTETTDNVTYVSGGQLIINGGTFIGDSDSSNGGCCVYDEAGGATINGGTFGNSSGGDVWGEKGIKIKINGGTFENLIETSHVTVGSTIVNGGKSYTMTENGLKEDPVAKIGETGYTSLQEAINEATDNAEIDVIANIELTAQDARSMFAENNYHDQESYCGIYIPDDKAIVLDLNGYTISYVDTYDNISNVMILNLGNLTINDSEGDGVITYKPVASTSSYSKYYSTIFNCGTVVVNAGTIENTCETATDVTNAVDNHSRLSHEYGNDCHLTVNGGTLIGANYRAIRLYTHYLEGVENRVTINDGIIKGGIYMQHGDSWYWADPEQKRLNVDSYLTINGGRITTIKDVDGKDYGHIRMLLNNPDNNSYGMEIKGGIIEVPLIVQVQKGYYYVNGVSGTTNKEETAASNLAWLEKNGGIISGGTFSTDVTEYLKDGYQLDVDGKVVEDADISNGTLEIIDGIQIYIQKETTINTLTYKRTLASDKFNALYVPFAIPVTEELLQKYDFFSFDAEQSAEDALVVTRVEDGSSLAANTPYLVRPKTDEAKEMELVLTDVKLLSTTTEQSALTLTSKDGTEFVITGTYSRISGADYKDFYGVSVNGRFAQIGETGSLGAFRFYMEIKNAESGTESSARSLSIRIGGESDDATGIDQIEVAEPAVNTIIDLQGRRVLQPQKGGLYIMNGKKVVF